MGKGWGGSPTAELPGQAVSRQLPADVAPAGQQKPRWPGSVAPNEPPEPRPQTGLCSGRQGRGHEAGGAGGRTHRDSVNPSSYRSEVWPKEPGRGALARTQVCGTAARCGHLDAVVYAIHAVLPHLLRRASRDRTYRHVNSIMLYLNVAERAKSAVDARVVLSEHQRLRVAAVSLSTGSAPEGRRVRIRSDVFRGPAPAFGVQRALSKHLFSQQTFPLKSNTEWGGLSKRKTASGQLNRNTY